MLLQRLVESLKITCERVNFYKVSLILAEVLKHFWMAASDIERYNF